MLIRKKYVRSLSSYLGGLIPNTAFKLAVDVANVPAAKLDRSGFRNLVDGDTLLPPAVGRISRVNSEGTFVVHRNRPKESRLVGRREWTRQEWAGRGETRTVTETVDIYRDCYPRTFVPPQGLELTVADYNGARLVVSPVYHWLQSPESEVLHAINLILEIFGELEIRHDDLASFLPPQTRRVNWTLLPPGNNVGGVSAHVAGLVARTAPTSQGPIMQRLTFLASRDPAEVYLGHGGFHAYVAYVFPGTGMTVLESVMPANATYVFAGNWAAVAHLTKSQILAGGHHHARIIHDANWEANLAPYAQ
ncbi:hypothetical protein [Caulobacter vibrioides]|uniref:hypothetical protein n=1 Tax=Caulobacter vibrioides TaxID=155892 RepID=UPI000F741AA5|nr:hypothetical protein [Caulobacter vibrioides]